MLIHRINDINLNDDENDLIEQIKSLKNNIDSLCCELTRKLHNDNFDEKTIQDIMYYSGVSDIVGRINVNKIVKNNYLEIKKGSY